MKVLSDWQTGNPPMPGLWLTRTSIGKHTTHMLKWDGHKWRWLDGIAVVFDGVQQYRGLAFNPEAARLVSFDDGDCWVVKVPR